MTNRNRQRDERGAVAIIISLFTVFTLFGLAALVVDLGYARDQKQAQQISTDSAALAGANVLYRTGGSTGCTVSPCFKQAVQAVEAYTQKNFPGITNAMWSSCTDANKGYVYTGAVDAGYVTSNCISFFDNSNNPNSTQPTKVRVLSPAVSNPTFFAGLTGQASVSLQTSARAKLQPGQNRSCGLCLLGSVTNNIGNGDLTVDGASIHTNAGFDVNPNGHVVASSSGSSITAVNGCNQNCSPAATYAPAITDPYAANSAIPPDWSTLTYKTGQPCTDNSTPGQGPGIYLNDWTMPKKDCTLAPGLYVVAGAWTGNNNTKLMGTGVTLYFACKTGTLVRNCSAPNELGGTFDMKNGVAQLTSPTTGQTKGFVIAYDRNNKSPITIQGNGGGTCGSGATDTRYTGTIYAAQALLTFPGTSAMTVTNGPIIAGQVYANGNTACMTLTSATGANIYVPPTAPNLDE
jgi:hypothetical protein